MASFNTIAGCVLASALFAMVVGKVSNAVVHPHKLDKPVLAVTDDALAFVREDADECLLVLAVRDGAGEITIDADALDAGEGARLANIDGGADDLVVSHAVITLPATGPGFQVWKV